VRKRIINSTLSWGESATVQGDGSRRKNRGRGQYQVKPASKGWNRWRGGGKETGNPSEPRLYILIARVDGWKGAENMGSKKGGGRETLRKKGDIPDRLAADGPCPSCPIRFSLNKGVLSEKQRNGPSDKKKNIKKKNRQLEADLMGRSDKEHTRRLAK